MTELVRYEAARRALAEAVAVDEVVEIRSKAEAMRVYARQANEKGLEIQAAQIRFRAEVRLGELLIAAKQAGQVRGGRPEKNPSDSEGFSEQPVITRVTLREAGIDHKLSSRAQRLATLDRADLEEALERHADEMRAGTGRVAMDLHRVVSELKGRIHRNSLARELSDASAKLAPSGRKYPVVYADPPWRRNQGVTDRSYENHYPTMTWDEICALPIADMVLPDAWLFLWIPRAHAFALHEIETEVTSLPDGEVIRARVEVPLGYAVAKSWGFDSYSTLAVWTKTDEEHPNAAGTGKIFRDQDELLLLFKRGQGLPMPEHKYGSNHRERPREHSRKPDFYREMIASMAGGLPVLELFARVDAEHPLPEGWGAWGNQSGPEAKEPEANAGQQVATSGLPAEGLSRPVDGRSSTATSEKMDVTAGEMAPNSEAALRDAFNAECGWTFRCECKPFGLECDAAVDAHWRDVIQAHQLPEPSGETEAAAADATDGASAAAAVSDGAPYDAADVVTIDQLAGSDWLAPSEPATVDPAAEVQQLSLREKLKILSDFCHKRRDLAPVIGPLHVEEGLSYVSNEQWQLRGKGWDRLRELEAAEAPKDADKALRVELTAPYVPPQRSFFDLARQVEDAPPAEVVDGALQTRLPAGDRELSWQLALLAVDAGEEIDRRLGHHLVGVDLLFATTKKLVVTDKGRAFLAQLVSPASVQQQGESHG